MIEEVSACGCACTAPSTATRGRVTCREASRSMLSSSAVGGMPRSLSQIWKRSRSERRGGRAPRDRLGGLNARSGAVLLVLMEAAALTGAGAVPGALGGSLEVALAADAVDGLRALGERDGQVRDGVGVDVERMVVDVGEAVAARVVARVVREVGRAAPLERLGGRLRLLGAREQAAGSDPLGDERPVVGAAAERRGLGEIVR